MTWDKNCGSKRKKKHREKIKILYSIFLSIEIYMEIHDEGGDFFGAKMKIYKVRC